MIAFGQAIRMCREACGFAQDGFAMELNRPLGYIEQLEQGGEEPSLSLIMECAEVLNISVGDLLELTFSAEPLSLLCFEAYDTEPVLAAG